jgi:hypothetical protein
MYGLLLCGMIASPLFMVRISSCVSITRSPSIPISPAGNGRRGWSQRLFGRTFSSASAYVGCLQPLAAAIALEVQETIPCPADLCLMSGEAAPTSHTAPPPIPGGTVYPLHSPYSFSMMATRNPCLLDSIVFIKVVFPAPRKPVTTVRKGQEFSVLAKGQGHYSHAVNATMPGTARTCNRQLLRACGGWRHHVSDKETDLSSLEGV